MKIYLVRHTSVTTEGFCYGQTDVPLKDSFEKEAKIVKQNLEGLIFDAVYSSPLSRCTRLATYCGYADDIQLFDRLKELHFGDWEMQRWDGLNMAEWEVDWVNKPTPNGESFKQMYTRVASFFDEVKTQDLSSVIAFTHGGVINCARVYFGKTELSLSFENIAPYGSISVFHLK